VSFDGDEGADGADCVPGALGVDGVLGVDGGGRGWDRGGETVLRSNAGLSGMVPVPMPPGDVGVVERPLRLRFLPPVN
jgi:hypothetical protein